MPKNRGLSRAALTWLPELGLARKERIVCRAEDIPRLVERFGRQGTRALGVTGEDLFYSAEEKERENLRILCKKAWQDPRFVFGKPTLCLMGPKEKSLSDFEGVVRVGVNRKYARLACSFLDAFAPSRLAPALLHLSGQTETAVREGLADLCTEVVCTGATMKKNGLRCYAALFSSDLVLIGFKRPRFDLQALYNVVAARRGKRNSYTAALLENSARLGEKILEEAREVVQAACSEGRQRVRAEAADLLYMLSVLLAREGVPYSEVYRELEKRNNEKSRQPPA